MYYGLGNADFHDYFDADMGTFVVFTAEKWDPEVRYRVAVKCRNGVYCYDDGGHGVAFFLPANTDPVLRAQEILTQYGWVHGDGGWECPVCNGIVEEPRMTPDMRDYFRVQFVKRDENLLLVAFVERMQCSDEDREKLYVLLGRVWDRCAAIGWNQACDVVSDWLWLRQDEVDGRPDYGWIEFYLRMDDDSLDKTLKFMDGLCQSWWEELPYPTRVETEDGKYQWCGFLSVDDVKELLRRFTAQSDRGSSDGGEDGRETANSGVEVEQSAQ